MRLQIFLLVLLAVVLPQFKSNAQCNFTLQATNTTPCTGTATTIYLSSSNNFESYLLYRNGSYFGSAGPDQGSGIQWTNITQSGTYTAYGNGDGDCGSGQIGSAVEVTFQSGSTITINQSPSSGPYCSGSTISFSASGGSSYTWSVNSGAFPDNNPVLTDVAPGSFTVSVQGLNSCGVTQTPSVNFTVYKVPNVQATPSSQSICNGQSMTTVAITNPNNSSGTTFSWTVSAPNISGSSSGSGTSISQSLSQATASNQTATYAITPSAGGCVGSSTQATITIKPVPNAQVSSGSQSTCSGQAMSSVTLSNPNGVSGTVLTWSVSAADISGASNGSTGPIQQTLSQSTNINQTATYTVAATANGCSGSTVQHVVTVKPLPSAQVSTGSQSICSTQSMSAVTLSNPNGVSGATMSWTVSAPNISGASNGSSGAIQQTLSQSTNTNQTATYSVTATANGCSGSAVQHNVTVKPIPSVQVSSASQSICSAQTMSSVTLSNPNGVSGTSLDWTVSASNISGASSGSTGPIAQTLSQTTSTNQTATYTVTASASGCSSNVQHVVTVKPIPNAQVSSGSQSICSGQAMSSVTLSNPNSVSGTALNWTVSAPNISGASAGSTGPIQHTLSQTTNTNQTATYTVTPSASGCSGSTVQHTVTVKPIPTVQATPSSQSICSGTTMSSVSLTNPNSVSGTTLSWTVSAPNISGTSSGSGSSVAQTLSQSTGSNQTATYTVTPSAASCAGSSTNFTVTVYPQIAAGSIGSSQTICSGTVPATLTNVASPTGGSGSYTYQWEQSTNGSSWSNASGTGTSATYGPPSLTSVMFYRRRVFCEATVYASSVVTSAESINMEAPVNQVSKPSGTDVRCHGSGTTSFSASASNATSYSWEVTQLAGGVTPGSISSSGVVTWNSSFHGTAVVKVNAQRCATTTSDTLHVIVRPTPVINAPLSQHIVSGSGFTFEPNFASGVGTAYSWTRTIGAGNGNIYGINTATPLIASGSGTIGANALVAATEIVINSTSTVPRTVTYAISSSKNGCSSGPTNFVVNVHPKPIVLLGMPYTRPTIAVGGSVKLKSNHVYETYQWRRDGSVISGATDSSFVVTQPGNYDMIVKFFGTSMTETTEWYRIHVLGYEPDSTTNMMITTSVRKAGITPTSNLYDLQPGEYMQSITYSDGLARPTQSISIGSSPLRKDVVAPYAYDSLQVVSYLPFVATVLDGYKKPSALQHSGSYTSSDQYLFYQQTTSKVARSTAPYAKTLLENSALQRPTEQGSVGSTWQPGGNHTVKSELQTNVASDVRKWTASGPSGYYDANSLFVNKVKDENGHNVFTFADKAGQTLLKRVQIDTTLNLNGTNVTATYLETYFVYDIRGSLVMQVPPKVVAMLNNSTSWSTTIRDQWCFLYTYDDMNRLVEKKTPDAAVVYYIYDRLDRLVLTQDANLRAQNKWMAVKYDIKGRPIATGIYQNTTHTTRKTLDSLVVRLLYSSESDPYFEVRGTDLYGYTNASFPTSLVSVLSVNYYDDHDFDFNGTPDFTYKAQGLSGEGKAASSLGFPTGSRTLILGSSNGWLKTYQFHDKFGRVIQSRSNNHLIPDSVNNLSTVVYDFEGKVLTTKHYHCAGTSNIQTIVNKTTYDHAGRPLKVYQNINGEARDLLVAQYKYNELGQVVEKNLHLLYDNQEDDPGSANGGDLVYSQYGNQPAIVGRSSVTFKPGFTVTASGSSAFVAHTSQKSTSQAETDAQYLQSVDYRYNIRGWVKSINNAKLDATGTNDDTGDYFGMELAYDSALGFWSTPYYNGNISAMKWKGPGTGGASGQRAYKYKYDRSDRLASATFQGHHTSWNQEVNTQDETQSYDHNGNILTLARKRNQRGLSGINVTSTPQTIDNLTYTYTTANQLSKVEDAVAVGMGTGDFKNNATASDEYTYTADGNLNKDQNKGISTITYNELGKPLVITYSGSPAKTVTYTYDGAGSKLKMVVYDGATTKTTDYVGGFVYENSSLSFFSSPEGRVVKSGANYEYQYAIADHQGNTRVVFSSQSGPEDKASADMESATNTAVQGYTNRTDWELFDHTDAASMNPNDYSQKLTGASNSQVGVAKSFKVYPGDKVKIEAWAKYYNPTSTGSNLTGFASMLLSAFGLSAPGGGETGTAAAGLNNWGAAVAGGGGHDNNGYPKGYVNIVMFDKNYNLLDIAYQQIDGGEQVGVSPKAAHDQMTSEYTVKEEGYAYLFVSNESPTLVELYFDDVTFVHTKSNVIQYNEYYPFGMTAERSWTRDGAKGNNYLHNGGTESNTLTGLYDLDFRNYDPILGRMAQVDPKADRYGGLSTYNYSFNDPVYWNDPMGADPIIIEGRLMNPRDNNGNETWQGSAVQYQMFAGALEQFARYGESTAGISIGGMNIGDYFQASNVDGYVRLKDGERVSAREILACSNPNQLAEYRLAAAGALTKAIMENILKQQAQAGLTPLDRLFSWLPGTRSKGSEVLVSAGSNIQVGIKKIAHVTFNPLSQVLYHQTWTNTGNSTYKESSSDKKMFLHREFGFSWGLSVNYKRVFQSDELGTLNGFYPIDNSEFSVTWFGIGSKVMWGTDGISLFYGGTIGGGFSPGVGGSGETWDGNVIK